MYINELINKNIEEIIKIRREIHQYPELGYEEYRTSAMVAEKLSAMGLTVKTGVAGTGVVADLCGSKEGKSVLLRADMDALPVKEETGLPFASKVDGKMHACGHDIHTAILLGTARVLSDLKNRFNGFIRFVFQPAEECSPVGGAKKMIDEGILENPKMDYAFALHVWPLLPVGKIGLKSGPISAQSDRIFINILGKSGHAATPHLTYDSITAAGHVIISLQTMISRRINPLDNVVLSLGKIWGGDRYNVICDKVEIEGTVRILSDNKGLNIEDLIRDTVSHAAKICGAQGYVDYIKGYPMTINDEKLTAWAENTLRNLCGRDSVVKINPDLGGEDFSFISQKIPSLYLKLGTSSDKTGVYPLHNSKVVFDEECIPFGISVLSNLVLELLKEGSNH
ncbi:M20 metallopeptidase family protein [Thermovenabulum gondwanense]|uniref:Putative hydrolase YxeP n=1 Tax=Thermovenabulum gondwanense TaxID=520767 RepID=A0A162MLL8_9FIRM|nr:M20 family metallopeptidase [Thermovenabulum gondwanense]KYO66576.1 putative hydrolase YxeP [Thermovenabulum gondwanense]